MKKILVVLSAAVLCVSAKPGRADGIGLTVTGALTLYTAGQVPLRPQVGANNYLDSANGAVPGGYGNSSTNGTAVIGSGVEFGVSNGQDLVTVDYTGTSVTVTDACIASGCGSTAYTLALYSPYITGYSLVSANFANIALGYGNTFYFPGGGSAGSLTFFGASNFTGGTLTLNYTSITPPASQDLLIHSLGKEDTQVTAVPEPASIGLMATGLLGAAGLIRRRFKG